MHSQTLEAIVLKVYDVGEADRFCILFTRERGRLAARARGVRKLASRIGGALLPFHHVRVELKETSAGLMATSAVFSSAGQEYSCPAEEKIISFFHASQGIELILKLLHDGQPLPEIFNATLTFLHLCASPPDHLVLAFTFHLLSLLGHLPEHTGSYFERCSEEDRQFVAHAQTGNYTSSMQSPSTLSAIASALINDQIASPLRARGMAAMFHSHYS